MRNKDLKLLNDMQALEIEADYDKLSAAFNTEEQTVKPHIGIYILSFLAGLISSGIICFLIFALGIFDSEYEIAVISSVLIITTLLISYFTKGVFLDAILFCLFILGQVGVTIALASILNSETMVISILLIINAISLIIVRQQLLKFICIFNILILLLYWFSAQDFRLNYFQFTIYQIFLTLATYVIFNIESLFLTKSKFTNGIYKPLRTALIIILFGSFLWLNISAQWGFDNMNVHIPNFFFYFPSIVNIILIDLTIFNILKKKLNVSLYNNLGIIGLVTIIIGLTYRDPSISTCLLLMLLSFKVNSKSGYIFAIIAFLYFLTEYYYNLSFSLLYKSITMIATGLLFGLLYFISKKQLHND